MDCIFLTFIEVWTQGVLCKNKLLCTRPIVFIFQWMFISYRNIWVTWSRWLSFQKENIWVLIFELWNLVKKIVGVSKLIKLWVPTTWSSYMIFSLTESCLTVLFSYFHSWQHLKNYGETMKCCITKWLPWTYKTDIQRYEHSSETIWW